MDCVTFLDKSSKNQPQAHGFPDELSHLGCLQHWANKKGELVYSLKNIECQMNIEDEYSGIYTEYTILHLLFSQPAPKAQVKTSLPRLVLLLLPGVFT